jgi:branched-chain amino acid aminotransferase
VNLLNGVFHEGTTAPFDVTDRGLTLGDGLFETMPVFGGKPFRLADHLDRLERGLRLLGFAVARARLEADVAAMAARAGSSGVLRLTVTRGAGARGLAPSPDPAPAVIVTLAPFNPALVFEPATLATASVRRNDRSPVSRLKALPYLDNVLALQEAIRAGAKDALMLNTADHVACSSVANVFRIKDDRLETPPLEDGVLDGITRRLVLDHAVGLGFKPAECSLTPGDLMAADAVFLTNSVRLIQPVAVLDGRSLATNDGPARILAALKRLISADHATSGTVAPF